MLSATLPWRVTAKHLRGCAAVAIPLLALAGCNGTAAELNQTTNFQGDTVPALVAAQIYHNVLAKDDNHYAMPAEIVIGTGQAMVSNQLIIPSATANLTGIVFRSFGLQNQNQWQQSWSIAAVTDPGDLQRLDALYRYAADPSFSLCDFVREYDRAIISSLGAAIRISDLVNDSSRAENYGMKNDDKGKPVRDDMAFTDPPTPVPLPPKSAAHACGCGTNDIPYSDSRMSPGKWPVPLPEKGFISINHPSSTADQFVGLHELHSIYVNQEAFAQFELWVLGATVNTGRPSQSPLPKGISGAAG